MPDHIHFIYRNQFVASMGFYLHTKKIHLMHQLTLEILNFQVYCNPKILLGLNTRIRILPDMEFAMGSYKDFHFRLLLRKSNGKIFAKT